MKENRVNVDDEYWMRIALHEAHRAAEENEVPVGCIIVLNGTIIGRGHNQIESLKDPTAHAEILAITAAARSLENWRLLNTTAYVTVEPCLMCTGALLLSRVKRVVYGTQDEKFGCLGSRYNLIKNSRFNHCFEITGGILADEAARLLKNFFQKKRKIR
ncbi:MAG: tRNA adenosine(34) deaminase TadA [candidate division WOR-3 bacterium]